MSATLSIDQTLAVVWDLVFRNPSEETRVMLLRHHMEAKHSRLLALSGGAFSYLAASACAFTLAPVLGWWVGLAAVPLSLLGAADGRTWRGLRYRWERPIVLPSPVAEAGR